MTSKFDISNTISAFIAQKSNNRSGLGLFQELLCWHVKFIRELFQVFLNIGIHFYKICVVKICVVKMHIKFKSNTLNCSLPFKLVRKKNPVFLSVRSPVNWSKQLAKHRRILCCMFFFFFHFEPLLKRCDVWQLVFALNEETWIIKVPHLKGLNADEVGGVSRNMETKTSSKTMFIF